MISVVTIGIYGELDKTIKILSFGVFASATLSELGSCHIGGSFEC